MTAHERIMAILDKRGITREDIVRRVEAHQPKGGRRQACDLVSYSYTINMVAAMMELMADKK